MKLELNRCHPSGMIFLKTNLKLFQVMMLSAKFLNVQDSRAPLYLQTEQPFLLVLIVYIGLCSFLDMREAKIFLNTLLQASVTLACYIICNTLRLFRCQVMTCSCGVLNCNVSLNLIANGNCIKTILQAHRDSMDSTRSSAPILQQAAPRGQLLDLLDAKVGELSSVHHSDVEGSPALVKDGGGGKKGEYILELIHGSCIEGQYLQPQRETELVKESGGVGAKGKHQIDKVGLQSMEMLKVIAVLWEKLRRNGVFSPVAFGKI